MDNQMVNVNPTPQMNLPTVPSNNLPAVQQPSQEDADLADLNSWIME